MSQQGELIVPGAEVRSGVPAAAGAAEQYARRSGGLWVGGTVALTKRIKAAAAQRGGG